MSNEHVSRLNPNFERFVMNRPAYTLLVVVVLILAFGIGLRGVEKDPSVDAFVPHNHPASVARDQARDVFGLEDPVIIALAAPKGENAFTPARLDALRKTDLAIRQIEGVKKNDVVSLASENAMSGENGDLDVDPIIPEGSLDAEDAALSLERFRSMPMLSGLLASESGDMLLIIAPVEDANHAEATVEAIKSAAAREASDAFEVHVSGVAAMNASLAHMVDTDTKIFVPMAILIVLCLLFVALRSLRALIGPFVVIVGSAAIAIGLMGWLGASYYLITTALPVVIMAIAVADSMHISMFYLKARRRDSSATASDAVRLTLARTWVPVTLTSVTTVAAFIGLSFGAAMRPISEFGMFAAAGVVAAWVLSLTALPVILILTDLKPAKAFRGAEKTPRVDRLIAALSRWAFSSPKLALSATVGAVGCLAVFAAQAEFDYERLRYFTADDPVRVADARISDRLGGVNFLDVMVTAPVAGDLMTPEAVAAIAELRKEILELPLVVKVGGIDEYISLMHAVLTGARYGDLPTGKRAPGQYMFLYEASGAPEDFKQEIDFDHSRALIRAQLSTDSFKQTRPTVDALSALTARWSARTGIEAEISGRVAVNDGWMSQLAANHYRGLGLAISLVLIASMIVFRSMSFAALTMLPLLVGVLTVYATMGAFGIDIAPATSMTAAIATGLGVDFGIHLVSHLRRRLDAGDSFEAALSGDYHTVSRACFYSAISLGAALAVICVSSAPPLRWFGFLVSVGAFGALVGALVMIPAIAACAALYQKWSVSLA